MTKRQARADDEIFALLSPNVTGEAASTAFDHSIGCCREVRSLFRVSPQGRTPGANSLFNGVA
jgi:hypothetical protein